MTQFNLILELTTIFKELLEASKAGYNVRHARRLMDLAFDRFEEMDGVEVSEMETTLDTIAIKTMDMPSELKDYFRYIENCQADNEIYPHDLPNFNSSIEFAQLATTFLTIVNDLLNVGITPCNAHQARLLLDDLFRKFEEQVEADEAKAYADDDHDPLRALFPNVQEDLDGLTLFPV